MEKLGTVYKVVRAGKDSLACNIRPPTSAEVPNEGFICTSEKPAPPKESQLSTFLLNALKRNAQLAPEAAAQIDGDTGERLTYLQFLEQTVRTAQGIRALGLIPGDAVSIIARNMAYTFTTVISVYLTGILEHPMNPYLEPELVAEQIHVIQPRLIFAESFVLDRIRAAVKTMPSKPRVVVLDSETADDDMMTMEELIRLGSTVDVESFEEAYIENQNEEDSLIIFTTGSTGPSKPVVHTPNSVYFLAHSCRNMFSESLLCAPLVSWMGGQCILLTCFLERVTLVYSTEITLEKMDKIIREYKIKSIVSSPFSAMQMALKGPHPEHLHRIIVGGSPMRPYTEKVIRKSMAPDASLMASYGSTEIGVMVSVSYGEDRIRHYTSGRLRPGAEMQVRDVKTGRLLGPNQRGELFIRSPSTMKGYHNMPEKTREVIDDDRWVKMGDYGYFDEDKFIYVLDRLQDIVYYKDNIILPSELCDVIRLHPNIRDAAVFALPHPKDRHHPVAFVSLKHGTTLTEEELNEHVLKHCSDSWKLRGGIVFLDKIPRTLSGKLVSSLLLQKIHQMSKERRHESRATLTAAL